LFVSLLSRALKKMLWVGERCKFPSLSFRLIPGGSIKETSRQIFIYFYFREVIWNASFLLSRKCILTLVMVVSLKDLLRPSTTTRKRGERTTLFDPYFVIKEGICHTIWDLLQQREKTRGERTTLFDPYFVIKEGICHTID